MTCQKASGGKKKGEGARENNKEKKRAKEEGKRTSGTKGAKAYWKGKSKPRKRKEKKRKNWKEKFITPADDLISRWKWKWRIFHFWYCKWVCWPDDFTDTTPDVNHQLEKTITEIKSVSPHQALTIAQLRRTLATLQRSPDEPAVAPITPSQFQPLPMLQTSTSQVQRSWGSILHNLDQ